MSWRHKRDILRNVKFYKCEIFYSVLVRIISYWLIFNDVILCVLFVIPSVLRRVRKIPKSEYYLRRVCLSVRMEQLGFHWMDFHEI